MSEQTNISFEAALMIALRADAQKELDTLPTPEQLEELYPDTSQWDERMAVALRRKKHRPMLKRVLVAALTLVVLTLGALAVSSDFRIKFIFHYTLSKRSQKTSAYRHQYPLTSGICLLSFLF